MKTIQADALNLMARDTKSLIAYSDALFNNQVKKAVKKISADTKDLKLVLVSGPSASGKRRTSEYLAQLLKTSSNEVCVIPLDNFFKSDNCPVLFSQKEFEPIGRFDAGLIENCLENLKNKGRAKIPQFDLETGRADTYKKISFPNGGYIILEGIHALNPALLPKSFLDNAHCVYVGLKTSYETKSGILNSLDLRIIRRALRDCSDSNLTPGDIIDGWDKIIQNERKWISPYLYRAKYKIDSTHHYEPFLYNVLFNRLVLDKPSSKHAEEIDKLVAKLKYFREFSISEIPQNSLVQEYVGRYNLKQF